MEEVYQFLKDAETYYLATMDGDQPRVRPFGTINEFEGKLYIQTGKVKPVSHQIAANPKVEICAFCDGEWIRVACELVEDDRVEAKKSMLDAYPNLRGMYDENDDNTQVFYMKNATATIDPETVTISGTPERLDQIESINLGSIDLSQIVTSEVVNMTIPVPEGVSIISGITSAKVTVSMSGLDTRIVQTSDIELINTPEWISNVDLVTQALEVRIRGASDTMKLVQDQDVYVIVDLSTLDEGAEGTRTLVATVGVRGFADVGAVGEYQVVVNITAS